MQTSLKNNLFDIFAPQAVSEIETPSIQLEEAITVDGERSCFIKVGKRVCVKNGDLVNGAATHKITSMRIWLPSTRASNISVIDLKTGELSLVHF